MIERSLLVGAVMLAPAAALEAQIVLRPPADIARDAPDVRLWIDGPRSVRQGETLRVRVMPGTDAYIAVARVDAAGRLRLLHPASSQDDGFVEGGVTYAVDESWPTATISDERGPGFVFVIASREPLDYSAFATSGRWLFAASQSTVYEQNAAMAVERFARLLLRSPRTPHSFQIETFSVQPPTNRLVDRSPCAGVSYASSRDWACQSGEQMLVAWVGMDCSTTHSIWATLPQHPCFLVFPFLRHDRRPIDRRRSGGTIALGGGRSSDAPLIARGGFRPDTVRRLSSVARRTDDRVVRGGSVTLARPPLEGRAPRLDPRVVYPETGRSARPVVDPASRHVQPLAPPRPAAGPARIHRPVDPRVPLPRP